MFLTNGNRPQAMNNYFSLLQYCTRVLYNANYSVVVCEWTQSWNSSTPPHNFSKTIYNKLLYRLLTGTNFIPKTLSLNGRNVQLACKLCRLCSAQEKLATPPYKKGDTGGAELKIFVCRVNGGWPAVLHHYSRALCPLASTKTG